VLGFIASPDTASVTEDFHCFLISPKKKQEYPISFMSFPSQHLNNSVSFDTAAANVALNKRNNQPHQQQSALFVNLYYGEISSLGL